MVGRGRLHAHGVRFVTMTEREIDSLATAIFILRKGNLVHREIAKELEAVLYRYTRRRKRDKHEHIYVEDSI